MGTEVLGGAIRAVIRVGICHTAGCPEEGDPVEVPEDQLSYTCECDVVVNTILYNQELHGQLARQLAEEKQGVHDDLMIPSFAPQLHLTREDEEET